MSAIKADLQGSCHILMESEVWLLLNKVSQFLAERNIESYVVGGLVRDALLERDTADIDIAVAADALEVASEVADAFGGKYVLLDKLNRIARVVLVAEEASSTQAQRTLDFSTFNGSIEQDLARRDFTIDAMAIELKRLVEPPYPLSVRNVPPGVPGLIDPFHGCDDLQRGVIQAVSDTIFVSDAARLLRAVRLAAELNFSLDKPTEALIRRDASLITGVAGERIREELLRLLAVSDERRCLPYLDELGLLMAVLPELAETRGVEQPKEHFWNVFEHSLHTVTAVDFLLRVGNWEHAGEEVLAVVPWSVELAQHFDREVSSGSTRRTMLKLAALLHDIRKPQTKALDGTRVRFLGHAEEGAATAADMLARLRFSSQEINLAETEIMHHMRPTQMSQEGLPTRRAIYRYFRDCGEAGIDILFLSLADHLATRGPHLDMANWQEHARVVDYVLSQYGQEESIVNPPRLVDGNDLIRLFEMNPGPAIGEILEAVREGQASGEVTTREEALALVERLKKKNA